MMLRIPLLVLLIAIPCGSATVANSPSTVVLGKVEIQTLRCYEKLRTQVVFVGLSKVGHDTLFTDRAKDIHSVVIEGTGLWRWRTDNDIALNTGLKGLPTDPLIIETILSGKDPRPITGGGGDEPIKLLSEDIAYYKHHAGIHIGGGGSVEHRMRDYLLLTQLTGKLLGNESLSQKQRLELQYLNGLAFMNLPGDSRVSLSESLGTKTLIDQWVNTAKQTLQEQTELFDKAQPANKGMTIKAIQLLVHDAKSRPEYSPFATRLVDPEIPNVYIVTVEPGTNLFLRINRAQEPPGYKDLSEASLKLLHSWNASGDVDLFLPDKGAIYKMRPSDWNVDQLVP